MLLVGSDVIVTNNGGGAGGVMRRNAEPLTAVESGTATELRVHLNSANSINYQLAIYDGALNFLRSTGTLVANATGWRSGAISDLVITSGQTYVLACWAGTGYLDTSTAAEGTYLTNEISSETAFTWPATLPNGSNVTTGTIALYAEGSAPTATHPFTSVTISG